MADEKQRITEFDTAGQLANDDYVLIDSVTLGTRKFDANQLGGGDEMPAAYSNLTAALTSGAISVDNVGRLHLTGSNGSLNIDSDGHTNYVNLDADTILHTEYVDIDSSSGVTFNSSNMDITLNRAGYWDTTAAQGGRTSLRDAILNIYDNLGMPDAYEQLTYALEHDQIEINTNGDRVHIDGGPISISNVDHVQNLTFDIDDSYTMHIPSATISDSGIVMGYDTNIEMSNGSVFLTSGDIQTDNEHPWITVGNTSYTHLRNAISELASGHFPAQTYADLTSALQSDEIAVSTDHSESSLDITGTGYGSLNIINSTSNKSIKVASDDIINSGYWGSWYDAEEQAWNYGPSKSLNHIMVQLGDLASAIESDFIDVTSGGDVVITGYITSPKLATLGGVNSSGPISVYDNVSVFDNEVIADDIEKYTGNWGDYYDEEHDQHYYGQTDSLNETIVYLMNHSGSSTLSGLTDTTVSNPTAGQVLTYDATTSKWINAAAGGGSMPQVYAQLTQVLTDDNIEFDATNPAEIPTAHFTGYAFVGFDRDGKLEFADYENDEKYAALHSDRIYFNNSSGYLKYSSEGITSYDNDAEVERLNIANDAMTITGIGQDSHSMQITSEDIEFSGYWGGGYWYTTKNLKDFTSTVDTIFGNFVDEDYHAIPTDYAQLTSAFNDRDIQVVYQDQTLPGPGMGSTLTFTGYSGIRQGPESTIMIGTDNDPNFTYMQIENDDIWLGEGWVSSGFQYAQSLKAVIGDLESRISTIENNL